MSKLFIGPGTTTTDILGVTRPIEDSERLKVFQYSGGELKVDISNELLRSVGEKFFTVARIQSSQNLVELILAAEILKRNSRNGEIGYLTIPYFPYARQDRVTEQNSGFSLKTVANLINSLGFSSVRIFDPHSDVTPALVNNVEIIPLESIAPHAMNFHSIGNTDKCVLVAPDAGAAKKVSKVAEQLNCDMIYASKKRDLATGKLSEPKLSGPAPKRAFIVDDICDGGRTFINLAKVLKDQGTEHISLYVTHGIFSQGLSVFDGLIDEIYTTDSFISKDHDNPKLKVYKIGV